jgi:hypothetical protein
MHTRPNHNIFTPVEGTKKHSLLKKKSAACNPIKKKLKAMFISFELGKALPILLIEKKITGGVLHVLSRWPSMACAQKGMDQPGVVLQLSVSEFLR